MSATQLSIVIADDHHLVREGLVSAITKKSNHRILGQAANGKELVELVKIYHPDMVITDIRMPILDGVEATKQITQFDPEIGVIALSVMDNEFAIVDVLRAGALGYLSKSSDIKEIIEAITKVYNKVPYYCSTSSHFLIKEIAQSSFNPYKKFKPVFTEQELRIMRFICLGKSSKDISELLQISVRTVDAHRRNILDNLKLKSTIGILIYALKNCIVTMVELPNAR